MMNVNDDNVGEKEKEDTCVGTFADERASNIVESNKSTDLPVYQCSADSEVCNGYESDCDVDDMVTAMYM